MSSSEAIDAARICPPNDIGRTANDFGVRKYTGGAIGVETSHVVTEVPEEFCDQWVDLYAVGGDVHYAFTKGPVATAEVDRTVAATDNGATVKVGGVIPNGMRIPVQIPQRATMQPGATDGKIYFVRESTALSTVVYMIKSGY